MVYPTEGEKMMTMIMMMMLMIDLIQVFKKKRKRSILHKKGDNPKFELGQSFKHSIKLLLILLYKLDIIKY